MGTVTTYMALLKTCTQKRDLCKGRKIHAVILKEQILKHNTFIGNALINMYAKCGAVMDAQQVFDALPALDVVGWTSMISAYSDAGHGMPALHCLDRMKCEAVLNDPVTFSSAIKACGHIGVLRKGKELHAEIVGECLLENDVVLGNALVDMYGKCGALASAQEVFDKLLDPDVASWTGLITVYCQHEEYERALFFFDRMHREGMSPNVMTYSCILKAYGNLGSILRGMQLHTQILQQGLLQGNSILGTALQNMYITCGAIDKAKEVFDVLGCRDVVSWTALIAGYCRYGHDEKAIFSFDEMLGEGLYTDITTFGTILQACGSIGAVEKGIKIHAGILREGPSGRDVMLGNALVDMYAKCGFVGKAQLLFDGLPVQNIASWTVLMAGYAKVGKHGLIFECLNKLIRQGVQPDRVLSSIVLNACRYTGLLDKGQTCYELLSASFCMIPTLEYYIGLVSLFGHAACVEKAIAISKKLPFANHFAIWSSLLRACRKWGSMEIAELAFRRATRIC